ncbi:MAG: acetyl-CoA synthetase [Chloroflexi bacterium RBG_13_54_8]|nr:MAG: acetyl-CoA synthetase [Chloroflexi bacterium RBG_13_54_8]
MEAKAILKRAKGEKRTLLTEVESKQLLENAGISVVKAKLATSMKEAVSLSKEMGFPVVLKIASPDVVHKSDVGGVKVDLKNATQVSKAYREIMASVKDKFPKAAIDGISVQPMAKPGVEVIIGMSKDPQFGPVLMFGLGGIFVEILKDVSFRIVPLLRRDAAEMIRDIKGFPVLQGYRGQPPSDITALENMILKVSEFVDKNSYIKEIDLNPVFARSDGAVAVDARVVLEEEAIK